MRVPILFVSTIVIAGLLGAAVARLYSEPMNQFLRCKWTSADRKVVSIPVVAEPALETGTVASSNS